MANFCPKPVRACALRATLLDECGVPVDVATELDTQIATKQFISLSFSPDVEEGEEFRLKNACGDFCINDKSDCPKLLGFDITLQMCGLPTHFLSLLMGMNQFVSDTGDIIGGVLPSTNFNDSESGCANRVLIEVWSKNADKNACDPETGQVANYIRWFLPMTFNWQWGGDTAFNNDILQVELTGFAEANTNFNSPVGLANDPDLTQEFIDQIQDGGPLAWIAANELPDLSECEFANPTP